MEEIFFQGEGQKEERNSPYRKKAALSNSSANQPTFAKEEHLKSYSTIRSLFSNGKRLKDFPLVLIWTPKENTDSNFPYQVAFSVPKRFFKRAVDRNKIKRQLKEIFRLNKSVLINGLPPDANVAIMFIYSSSKKISYSELENKLLSSCQRLLKEFT